MTFKILGKIWMRNAMLNGHAVDNSTDGMVCCLNKEGAH